MPRNWRVRSKLTAVVLIPGVLAASLGAVSLSRTVGDADDFGRFSDLARFQQPALRLVGALQDERDLTAGFIAGGRETSAGDGLREQRAKVDDAADAYRAAAGALDTDDDEHLRSTVGAAAAEIRTLPALRAAADQANLTQGSILAHYTTVITRIMDLGPDLAEHNGGSRAAEQVRALNTLSRAVEETSRVRCTLGTVLAKGTFLVGQFPEFTNALARQQESVSDFLAAADEDQQNLYADTVKGASVSSTLAIQERAAEQAQSARLDIRAATWTEHSTRKIALMRQVQSRILGDLIEVSAEVYASRLQAAVWGTIGLIVLFGATGWTVILVVRSLTRPLRRLRVAALEVADGRLPDALRRLRQADVDDLSDFRATPTGVASNDEIGEVAQAFDAVQHAAVGLVTDQVALRRHINGMFVHLSRRNQGLVSKLIAEIGDLEQNEHDPDRLAQLFRLDHLATRMQRTDESLLVLAGSDTGRSWPQAMPLSDILLAASAEVEQYTRISCRQIPEVSVAAGTVTDLVHLLAELMENATVFSDAGSPVTVTCRPAPDRATDLLISIADEGTGIAPAQLAALNSRLSSDLSLDPGTGQSMGLVVVGRLASRHGIGVRLVPSARQGTTALVRVPRRLMAGPALPLAPDPGPGTEQWYASGGPAPAPATPAENVPVPSGARPDDRLLGASPHRTADGVPIIGSPEEWLNHRRFSDGLRAVDRPSRGFGHVTRDLAPDSLDHQPSAEGQA